MVIRRVVIVGCMLWCSLIDRMLMGIFLGSTVTYLLRNHAILVEKSCGGSCKAASSGLVWFSM